MRNRIFLLPLLFLFAATSAMAEGFYAGGSIGLTQIEDEDPGISFEDNPLGWRLLAGYDFSDHFGIEGSFINSGEAEDDVFGENVKVEFSAFTLSIVGLLPVGESAQLFGKLGFFSGELKATVLGFRLDEDEDGATVGAGIRWNASDTFAVRGEFDWYDTDLDTLWSIGVGIQYYFEM